MVFLLVKPVASSCHTMTPAHLGRISEVPYSGSGLVRAA